MSKQIPKSFNLVLLAGVLHRPPQMRTLASGESLTVFDVRVPDVGTTSSIVTATWFDAPASALMAAPGDPVVVFGQVRRYWFAGKQSVTDVRAHKVLVKPGHRKMAAMIDVVLLELESAWSVDKAA